MFEPTRLAQDRYANRNMVKPRIGVFGCGHWLYWQQFDGLRDRLVGHQRVFERGLEQLGAEVISGGLSDTPQGAIDIGNAFCREGIDLLICYLSTYALSSAVLPVIQRAGAPLLIVSLQPTKAMDYARGTTFMQLEHDNQTSLPEVCNALQRSGIDVPGVVVGTLYDDDRAWQRIDNWVQVARACAVVRDARIGIMGHVYEGMLDMNTDPTLFDARFGMHCEHLEMDDLHQCVAEIGDATVRDRIAEIHEVFDFPEPGSDPIAGPAKDEDVIWAARVSCGLDLLVERFGLSGLSFYYRGLDNNANERLGASLAVGSSLLTGRGIPVTGELDVKTCIAMLVVDQLQAGGSFAEIHPCDFENDIVLVGHDGPHHIAIAEGRPVLRSLELYHGKRGSGVGVEFQIVNGPVTCVALTQTLDGRIKLVVAEGESLPGAIPATGNTNTRCRFMPDTPTFIENWSLAGPTHHFALAVGHVGHMIASFARCWGIECMDVTDPTYRRPAYIR